MAYAKMIGAEVKRKEDPRLITGRGTYVPNVNLPNMHYVGFVRSPLAHANIISINTAAALAVPGVVAVITGEDLKSSYGLMLQGAVKDGTRPRAHYPLSVERVRHVGEAIVAVVATSAQAAADGVAAVGRRHHGGLAHRRAAGLPRLVSLNSQLSTPPRLSVLSYFLLFAPLPRLPELTLTDWLATPRLAITCDVQLSPLGDAP